MLRKVLTVVLKATAVVCGACFAAICAILIIRWLERPEPTSAEGLLARADDLAWKSNWTAAFPLYGKAEALFLQHGDHARALYARVSRTPVLMESTDLKPLIAELNSDLQLPDASQPDIRLRILEVKARCEEEYNAGLAAQTLASLEKLALDQYRIYLASRASGERGILAFTLGNFEDAATRVKRAYAIAKYFGDSAAHVRFAGMIGMGLAHMGKVNQALVFLNEAIETQKKHPDVAVPYIAINAKIDSLSGLGRDREALALADLELSKLRGTGYLGQLQSLLTSRSDALLRSGRIQDALAGYIEAVGYARKLSAWRAITDIDGKLALAYEREQDFPAALSAVDDAIRANNQAPQEIFLVPGNLALKAKILAEMGRKAESERLYAKGADVIDVLLSAVPTPEVERLLIAQLGDLYSGYFRLVSDQGRLADAFSVIERARGRIEAQQLEFNQTKVPRLDDPEEVRLQQLELKLLADTKARKSGIGVLAQLQVPSSDLVPSAAPLTTAPLPTVQQELRKEELLIEYVLAEPQSYALAIGKSKIARHILPAKNIIAEEVGQYRSTLLKRRSDSSLARKLFGQLLGFVDEYPNVDSLIVVADGDLHLLPFSALMSDRGQYLIEAKMVSMAPSGTVLRLLRNRSALTSKSLPYLGVAPWVDRDDSVGWALRRRGGDQNEKTLLPLPQSRDEVQSIAAMMPPRSTLLIGSQATRDRFRSLPLSDYRILHLAMHGIVDPVFPDRSSLVFAPSEKDDGHLQARDIRRLQLRADLVTLSACDTAVGPVSAAGVESLDAAFIQAGADAVISTLWELQDSHSAMFMKNFYSHLRGECKAAALRDAKLALLHGGMEPYYWATYELVGNPSGSPFGTQDEMACR